MSNKYKAELENTFARLKSAGIEKIEEKEQTEISRRFIMLVDEWRVPSAEASRTVVQATLKTHGIDTKVWATGGTAAPVLVDQIKADNEWISLKARVVQIWDNTSEKVAMTGLVGDSTGVVKFTIFAKNEDLIPSDFQEGGSYLFENFVTQIWNGQASIKGNKTSKITHLSEEIEASRKTDTITGLIVSIQQGSGLIKRCPECNRALMKGSCQEHGRVDGIYDLRIKGVLSVFGSNELIELIVGKDATEKVMDMTVDQAKGIAMESLDTGTVLDLIRKKLTAQYVTVTGSMMSGGAMIIENMDISEEIATEGAIKETLSEIKGGN